MEDVGEGRPSTAQHPLTTEEAARVHRRRCPDVEVDDLRHLGSGREFDAFRCADDA